ncbi:hypothetical protein [Hespellia stercorisuis]|uniref:Uncharacterized protein n=1 Tax=Hespellia stercorisuis DSM 15480 TaxID=1121950 RepID=A0A1M6WBA6_9FIRM|nr:hypothetical protein [Hespellia stercorisuis]SHK91083.1 hypothetical protein SAMN02745243_03979 [Hespellia stercorisuis DSM 15480]
MTEKRRCVKMDEIMKNMLIHSLLEVFREEKAKDLPKEVSGNLILRIAEQKEMKLFLTDAEYQKVIEALNKLRDSFIHAGRYPDGIDSVMIKIIRAKYKRYAER